MDRRILVSVAVILLSTATPAFAAPTTQHHQSHLGSVSSRSTSAGCSFATGVKHTRDLRMSCSSATGHAVGTYTFHIIGTLMGTQPSASTLSTQEASR